MEWLSATKYLQRGPPVKKKTLCRDCVSSRRAIGYENWMNSRRSHHPAGNQRNPVTWIWKGLVGLGSWSALKVLLKTFCDTQFWLEPHHHLDASTSPTRWSGASGGLEPARDNRQSPDGMKAFALVKRI
ncbi:hypothetical protein TcWFU_006402 [Taenia crassiceps]|uniref:Uncharacterized protein n=1 Tax=Taenia crassiceps TaxID=6207 RepID=A0ABR4Q827_9CEST